MCDNRKSIRREWNQTINSVIIQLTTYTDAVPWRPTVN